MVGRVSLPRRHGRLGEAALPRPLRYHLAGPRSEPVPTIMHVRDLYIYPLKSCAGGRLDAAQLDRFGLVGDRRWMLVDRAGRFLSQRELPRMALLRVTAYFGALAVSAPDRSTLTVSVPAAQAPRVPVTVWRDRCEALDAGDEAARWMCAFVERECRLVYAPDDFLRPVDRAHVSGRELMGVNSRL
ncbi:MAG: hypothetical protein GEV06_10305 [Luteitalea sp.]|nr:hypothetical protein [Luteitalea sp.]